MLPKFLPRQNPDPQAVLMRRLIAKEGEIGGKLFGPIPEGHRREFFCLDEHTWVWHEEWIDQTRQARSVTTRYEVRPSGVLKAQDGQAYQRLSLPEARNLYQATQIYRQRIAAYYQRLLQQTA